MLTTNATEGPGTGRAPLPPSDLAEHVRPAPASTDEASVSGVRRMVPSPTSDPDDVSLAALGAVLSRYRRAVLTTACVAAAIVLVITLWQPRTYRSEAMFVPQSRKAPVPGGLAGIAEQLGVSVGGLDAAQNPSFYVDLLKSRPILEQLVDARYVVGGEGQPRREVTYGSFYHLRGDTPPLRREAAIKQLSKDMETSLAQRTGVVTMRVTTRDPGLAQAMAARALQLLDDFNQVTRRSQASAERRFTEQRLAEARAEQRAAEDRLAAFLGSNLRFDNAPYLRTQGERLQREVVRLQGVVSTLSQAFEQARIEEVRDTPLITVIEVPERPVRAESRALVVKTVLAFVLGAITAMLMVLARGAVRRTPVTARVGSGAP